MVPNAEAVVHATEKEWRAWGESRWDFLTGQRQLGHVDDDIAFAAHILEEYCTVCAATPSLLAIRDKRFAWSAVFLCAMLKQAGFHGGEFPFSALHADYLTHFIKARRAVDRTAAFWGYRCGEPGAQPQPGDLVAFARGEGIRAEDGPAFYERTPPYFSHTDIVVAARPGILEVIGGNVLRSVTRKILPLDAHGHLADAKHPWFTVLKLRQPAGSNQ